MAAAKVLFQQSAALGFLVVAPLRPAMTTWPDEQKKWADFNGASLVVLHGPRFSQLCRERHHFYVINYEGLSKLFTRWKVGKVWKYGLTEDGKALMKNVNGLIWDEISKMRNQDTLRFKLIEKHLKNFLFKWGLTGTPASKSLINLFGQSYVLDEGATLGRFVTHYRAEFFTPVGYDWQLQVGAKERIYKKVRPLYLRMEDTDHIKLPPQLDHQIKFELPDDVRPLYDQMEEDMLTAVGDRLVVAPSAAVKVAKLRQIATGAIYVDDIDAELGAPRRGKKEWHQLHDAKLDLLEDLVDELQGQQLLVAYEFIHDRERLAKRFPQMVFIGGGVSAKRGKEIQDAWNNEEIELLGLHPASGAYGLNLQESSANHICWFTLTWDRELYDQLNRRLRRRGSKADAIHVYHMMAKDSADESVLYSLRRKYKTQKELLDAVKMRLKEDDLTSFLRPAEKARKRRSTR